IDLMKPTKTNIKLIFGLKLRQLRQDKNLSLSELALKSGLSVSYLNEIESGKKYPKTDKIAVLSEALNISYDKLVSLKLSRNLAPIGDLLDSKVLEQLPLDHYGIDINKLVVLMANAPMQLSALVATLVEMARSSELSQNNFSRTALRTYKELNENYFEDLEEDVEKFVSKIKFPNTPPVTYSALQKVINEQFDITVDEKLLDDYPELSEIRAIYIPGKTNKLAINKNLNDAQKTFILGKEIAYQYLDIKDRSNLYSAARVDSFDQLLNNLRASYFATSLMLKRNNILLDLKQFFKMKKWDDKKLLELIHKYNATPEIFLQRFTNLAFKFLNLNSYFFLRFNTIEGSHEYHLTKELRLNTSENPGGYQSVEHYCRRWISIGVLNKLEQGKKGKAAFDKSVVGAQISEFYDSGEQYFSISISRRNRLIKGNNISITVGFLINDDFKKKIKFWNDQKIPVKIVNNTCERCNLPECRERIAPAVVAEQNEKYDSIKSSIEKLINEAEN
ncbi:MAG: helix-turn-helix domain-containing protein, partial [Ignavibacteria bacterium]|nr:helix-turn-helix domain-containing protein [Ignavibacteria bacterium]